jgi:YVTN family beta-propeller protein
MAVLAIPAQAHTVAYVANSFSNSVSVIDTASNTVVATVGVGMNPFEVAITPDGTRAYVTNFLSNSVSVIDTASNTVVNTVGVGANPNGVAITPDGTRAYVTIQTSNVSVIDTASNTVVARVGVGMNPFGVAITPDGTRAYVTIGNFGSYSVSVIDTASNTVVATVGVGNGPDWVAITPDGTRAYVANSFSNSVSVIDTASNTVVATVGVGMSPGGVAITPDGTRAYVTNANSSSVSVIDTASNTVTATVPTRFLSIPLGVAITPDGTRAYVTNNFTDSVSVIDTASNTVVATVDVGGLPEGVAITPAFGTRTSLKSSLNPSIYGQKVTFTAIVKSSGPIPPTGRVKFTWGDTIGSAPLNSHGVATFTRSNLNADPYPLVAVYSGDAHNLSGKSAVLNQVIVETTSAATITSSQNPSPHGQPVTLTATITSPTVIPTGPVTFSTGKTVLGTAQLGGGKAKFTISTLGVGSTTITATYYGDSNIAKSSASVIQNVK